MGAASSGFIISLLMLVKLQSLLLSSFTPLILSDRLTYSFNYLTLAIIHNILIIKAEKF